MEFLKRAMNRILSGIVLVSLVAALASCDGQRRRTPEPPGEHAATGTIGDTVLDIGKNIDCVLQDRDGNYWFASNGEGVYRYDGRTLIHITEDDGLCSNFVLTVQQDINGNLWFSTRDGICRLKGTTFTDYTITIRDAPKARLRYTRGGLFFGHANGVCFYDGTSFTNFVIHPGTYSPEPSDMNRPYGIYSTLVDNAGNIWFGTQSQGVCRYDGDSFSYLTDKNLAGPAVRTIFQDRTGILWFGNNGGGLYRYDGKTLSNITDEKNLGNPEFLSGHFIERPGSLARVWTINEDNEGNLWIGTIDAGVWKYDGKHLTNYTTKDGLAGNSIWMIYKDHGDHLWFVTNGETLCKFNGKTFTKFVFH